jgi:NitT/TauT family transport system ATP-binding protein
MSFECAGLSKVFRSGQDSIIALSDVNFEAGDGQFICIVGPSGCGKTTLLRLIAGLDQPSSGSIAFDRPPRSGQLRAVMVFQHLGLFPWMTVLDNVAFGLRMQHVSRKTSNARARHFLARVGLRGFEQNYPHELSGGMRQRVAILRAFLSDSQTLLMDEPFGSLDSQTRLVMQEELLRIWKDYRRTVIYVTHDIEEAILLGDKVLVMSGRPGTIRRTIPVDLKRPRHLADQRHPDVAEMRLRIWKMLEDEVRSDLGITTR